MTELTPQNFNKTQKEWENWYLERYPDAIDNTTDKAYDMLSKHKKAMNSLKRDLVKKYLSDLVLVKSKKGLIAQEMVLNYLSIKYNTTYRLATPEEESQGITGYVGEKPMQVKPHTYFDKPRLEEEFPCDVVIYKGAENYLCIYFEE